MSLNLTAITNENTFGIWKDRTNEMITGFGTVVTLGNTASANTGNIALTGNVSAAGTIFTDTIDALGAGNLINLNATLDVNGDLGINATTSSKLKFYLADVLKWTAQATSESIFEIKNAAGTKVFKIDGSTNVNVITGTGLTISNDILPASITSNITGNAATATKWAASRNVAFTGDVTGNFDIDGSAAVSNVQLTVGDNSHSHESANITDLGTTLLAYMPIAGGTFTEDVHQTYGKQIKFNNAASPTDYSSIRHGTYTTNTNAFVIHSVGNHFVSLGSGATSWSIVDGITPKVSIAKSTGNFVTIGDITAFGSVSDIRRKENIVKIDNALDKISKVSGYTYNYKGDKTPMTGVIAQEFEEILPEVVYETELLDGTTSKAVRHGNIVGLLIESIKELKAEIEELKKDR